MRCNSDMFSLNTIRSRQLSHGLQKLTRAIRDVEAVVATITGGFHCASGVAARVLRTFVNSLRVRQRCGPFLNEGIEFVQVDWFYQVMVKTDLAASADILFHSKTSESNRERRS